MNKYFKTLSQGMASAMALAIALAALLPTNAQAQINPIEVAKNYTDAVNNADFDQALALFADDAVVKNPLGVFVGKTEIAQWLKEEVKTTRVAPKTWEMKGPLVVSTGAVALARFTQVGVPYVDYRAEYLVNSAGKLRFFAPVPLPTAEQMAKLQPVPLVTPKVDPIKIAQAYLRAVNQGNPSAEVGFFAPNAAALVFNGAALYSGKAQINAWHLTEVKTTRAKSATWVLRGNTVINTGTVSFERLRKLGIEWVEYRTEYLIENGKIRFFRGTALLTPEQQAKLAAGPSSK